MSTLDTITDRLLTSCRLRHCLHGVYIWTNLCMWVCVHCAPNAKATPAAATAVILLTVFLSYIDCADSFATHSAHTHTYTHAYTHSCVHMAIVLLIIIAKIMKEFICDNTCSLHNRI